MVGLRQEMSRDITTTPGDTKEHFGEMGHVVALDKRVGEDLEDGLRR